MKQGAVYIRVSTDDQTEYSPDAQLKRIKEYARTHNILITEEYIYIENGVSGRTVAKREQFKKMIQKAKEKPKPFDVVLIHAYDRFARNVKESRIYKELLRDDLGIELISITEDFGTGKNSFLMEGIKDILNEYYSLNLRDEVLKGMYEKISRGEVCGKAVLGYDLINKKLVINKEEKELVNLIYNKYANTNEGLIDIAKYLNNAGFRTKAGNLFENRTISYILRNPIYIGKLRYSKKGKLDYNRYNNVNNATLFDGIHEPIIENDLWLKVQNKLDKNLIFSKPHQISTCKVDYWLKGMVRCSECGHTLIRNGWKKDKLRCNGYSKGKCSNYFTIPIKEIEEIVLNQIKKDFNNNKIQLNIKQIKTYENNERDIIKRQITNLENKLNRCKEAYLNEIDTLEEYKTNKNMILKEIERLNEELKTLKEPTKINKQEIQKNIKEIYNLLTNDNVEINVKKEAINTLIDKIIINNKDMKISIIYNSSPF